MKNFRRIAAALPPLLMASIAVSEFFIWVNNYFAHADGFPILAPLFALVNSILLIPAIRKKRYILTAFIVLMIAACIWSTYWQLQIPFCPMCEGLSESDIGWLSRWIECE